MVVPRGMHDINEANSALDHTTREKAITPEGLISFAAAAPTPTTFRVLTIKAVCLLGGLTLAAEIGEFRCC